MDPLGNIWQVALALIAIVAVVYALGYVARRMQGMGGMVSSSDKCVKVIESTYLGPKERLVVVEVAGQRLLLAINPQSITKISDMKPSFPKSFEQTLEEATS